jgi:NAD+ synthase (glutamine-hydrolysing)
MKIALAQINPTVGDITGNVAKIVDFSERARGLGADIVVFPELAVCGYPPLDLLLKPSFVGATLKGVDDIKVRVKNIAVVVGFVDRNEKPGRPLRNACAFLHKGDIQTVQYKTLLPSYDVFDEDRYFEPAVEHACATFGDSLIGLSICEDIWNDESVYPRPRYQIDPIANIVAHKPRLLINISASPFSIGKQHIRHELVRNHAERHGIPVVYLNTVGGNDELIFDGRSIVVDESGKLIAQAAAFEEDLIVVDLDTHRGPIKDCPEDNVENIHKALTLGARDYMRKCGFARAVVGLSGGIDSAVVAALAVEALGQDNVLGVLMPSPHSSAGSVTDAKQLAANLGIRHEVVPISSAMATMDETLGPMFAGTKPDLTEENIQARLRGLILMALSNKFGYLVLTTGNKSELAVGYCTLYGDMCGGLALISDLPKMMVYELARYINEKHGREIIPSATIEKAPSAELRPDQKDQDTLPPYVVLDGILRAYVEERKSASEIVKLGYRPEVVMDVINRIDRNEYKRYQAAPGLKVTSQSFGFGWRMPIAQRFREPSEAGKTADKSVE